MKYRLDADHYDEFVELPAGTEVGDGCAVPWRYGTNAADPKLRGQYKPPSQQMTPLDDEAKAAYEKRFGTGPVERDPTKKVPIMGTDPMGAGKLAPDTGATFTGKPPTPAPAPIGKPNPAPNNPTEKFKTGVDVTKDDSLAKEDPALNKTPNQPTSAKPAGTQ